MEEIRERSRNQVLPSLESSQLQLKSPKSHQFSCSMDQEVSGYGSVLRKPRIYPEAKHLYND